MLVKVKTEENAKSKCKLRQKGYTGSDRILNYSLCEFRSILLYATFSNFPVKFRLSRLNLKCFMITTFTQKEREEHVLKIVVVRQK